MSELSKRINSSPSKFFKKFVKAGMVLTAASTTILGSDYLIHFPEGITKVAGYLMVAGIVLSSVAKLTVNNPEEVSKG